MAIEAKGSFDSDTITAFIAWYFLIPLGASWLQSILYSIFIRAGDPRPQHGSPRFARHRRQILLAIYVAYFAFVIYEVDFKVHRSGNAYTHLGVPFDVEEKALASRFRKLTMRYHPDKIQGTADRESANEYYVFLKHARDLLMDPSKRFAYDRFGPDIIRQCRDCLTTGEYVKHALRSIASRYGALAAFLLGANALGFLKEGAYWRCLSLVALAAYEARTAMRPDHGQMVANYVNPILFSRLGRQPYLPFQVIILLRKSALSMAQFLGLAVPLWREDARKAAKAGEDSDEARQQQVDRLERVVREGSQLASRLVDMETMPYRHNERAKSDLKAAMKRYMMTNAVHMDREVRNAMGQSYARRHARGRGGLARGT
ncbi:uncharacterized protein EI97DRAFT_462283 [Westerdykella ornata]|uniref:J domain-containing protein n=1 Tax=Westerdykella ornata TaxID=318751 RepID=A0A6A6J8W8_WESOR|nr:uncharacterized protein EI97DRAFT_462283 [Westerdykella ornata]KAF2272086.1 hypothetical protein EI97DRAFT_462283 [Westerdykella ornata]